MFQRAADTNLFVSKLQSITEADTLVTFDQLSEYVGHPVDGTNAHLHSARRILAKEHGQVWLSVRGEGIRLAPPQELAPHHRQKTRLTIHRRVKRASIDLKTVNLDDLTESQRQEWGASFAYFTLMTELTRNTATKRIAEATNGTNETPAVNKLLEHLKDK